MPYFLLYTSGADHYLREINPHELIADLNKGYYGDNPVFESKLPDKADLNEWPTYTTNIIIKGEIVTPKPVVLVKEFTLEE